MNPEIYTYMIIGIGAVFIAGAILGGVFENRKKAEFVKIGNSFYCLNHITRLEIHKNEVWFVVDGRVNTTKGIDAFRLLDAIDQMNGNKNLLKFACKKDCTYID